MGVPQAKNRPMEVIEQLREEAGISKSAMARCCGLSRTKYYDHMEAKDIKVEAFKEYLRVLGWKLILTRSNMDI